MERCCRWIRRRSRPDTSSSSPKSSRPTATSPNPSSTPFGRARRPWSKTTAAARTSRPSGRSSRRSTARKSAKATRAFSRISTPMSSTPRATSAALIPRRWRRSISSKSAATALRWRRIRSFPTWRRRTASAGRALCRRILKFTRPTRPRPSASRILPTTSRSRARSASSRRSA